MNNTVAIDFLKFGRVMLTRKEHQQLLYIEVHGYSMDAQAGVPKIVLREPQEAGSKDMLEFDFVVTPGELLTRRKLRWEIKQVVDVSLLPLVPSWIKVNAAHNADILAVEELKWDKAS